MPSVWHYVFKSFRVFYIATAQALRRQIKTHGMSCGPRKRGARKAKLRFSRIYNSVVFYLINPKVAVKVPAYQGRLHTKFEENRTKHFRDMSEQTFKFFSSFHTLEKIAVTRKLVLQSSWNLVHLSGVKRRLSASILVRIRSRSLEL